MTAIAEPTIETTNARFIKDTASLCPRCLERIPARVFERAGEVWMRKRCDTHGQFEVQLDADARHYIEAEPESGGGGACCGSACGAPTPVTGGANAPGWSQHSCTVLIEIIERCNLTCPTCFAGSSPQHSGLMSMDEFRRQVDGLAAGGKRAADMIQLSGGEPTIHPRFFDMVAYLLAQGFGHVVVNSNGIKLAQPSFVERLATVLVEHRGVGGKGQIFVYLQFDGFDESTHEKLRGRGDLLEVKRRALANCAKHGLSAYPVMSLTRGINDHEVGDFIALADSQPSLRNLVLQPVMYSGRYDNPAWADRITLGDTVALIREQYPVFEDRDFVPIPCSDPNCYRMAAALRTSRGLLPITRFFPRHEQWEEPGARELVERFSNTIDGTEAIDAAMRWALGGDGFGQLLGELDDELVEELLALVTAAHAGQDHLWDHVVTISIKPFMDAWSYDQDRVDQCCVHILDADGNPVSFCEYNAINRPRKEAARSTHNPLGITVLA